MRLALLVAAGRSYSHAVCLLGKPLTVEPLCMQVRGELPDPGEMIFEAFAQPMQYVKVIDAFYCRTSE